MSPTHIHLLSQGHCWWEIDRFPFISYARNLFGIYLVWYKSKYLEQFKDAYRGTTVSWKNNFF